MSENDELQQVIESASTEPVPAKALRRLLEDCVRLTGAAGGRIYRLFLATGMFEPVESINGAAKAPAIDAHIIHQPTTHFTPTQHAIRKCKPIRAKSGDDSFGDSIIVPIVRGEEALGTIEVFAEPGGSLPESALSLLGTIAPIALFLFERDHTLKLLKAEQQPINFQQAFRDFLNAIILLTVDASGMPFVVLSEHVDDTLVCRAQYGLSISDDPADLVRLDVSVLEDASLEETLRTSEPFVVSDFRVGAHTGVGRWWEYGRFRSYVLTRVTANDKPFGILWFGYHLPFHFSLLEVESLDNISTGIGVHISNYSNLQRHQADIVKAIEVSAAITTVEVAQAARHEARSHLDLAQTRLSIIDSIAGEPTRQNLGRLQEQVRLLGATLSDISLSLEKIKSITKPPERTRTVASLTDIWLAAFHIVEARLLHENIDYRVVGKSVRISVYSDFLVHAFLNMILNSIDAFRELGKKRNRSIVVTIEPVSDSANAVRMRYTDNATGIEPSNLVGPKLFDQVITEHSIFEAGVTSKKAGSGFGLYLVRKILQEHNGSIDLKSHRGGVTFEITLPNGSDKKDDRSS